MKVQKSYKQNLKLSNKKAARKMSVKLTPENVPTIFEMLFNFK